MPPSLRYQLHAYFASCGFEIHGGTGIEGLPPAPLIANDGFGSGTSHRPAVIGFDPGARRIVFGVVRETRAELDSEESLEEYNVFLDHNAGKGERASALYVIMPEELLPEWGDIVSHYIHREYWERLFGVTGEGRPSRE